MDKIMPCIPTGRKSYLFELTVGLEMLTSVPFVNGVIFAKMRLVQLRNSKIYSSREPIKDHVVTWNSEHKFQCRSFANVQTNMLESNELKISIRKEIKGGKSSSKLGYVLVNISCFANLGDTACRRRYILEGYNEEKRQDNSMLQMHFTVCQLFGDPCFRVPQENMSKCVPYEVVPSQKLLTISPNCSFEGIDRILTSDHVDSKQDVTSCVFNLDEGFSSPSSFLFGATRNPVADIYNEISRKTQFSSQESSSPFLSTKELNDPHWSSILGESVIATIPKSSKQTDISVSPGYSTCPYPTSHENKKKDQFSKEHRRFGSGTGGSGSTAARTVSSGYCSYSRQSSSDSTSCGIAKSHLYGYNDSLDKPD